MQKSDFKIMVVNDKNDLRNVIRDYLRSDGYTTLTISENGKSAYKKATAEPPDLIIADMELEGYSGLELLQRIRQIKSLRDLPFIMLSAETMQKYIAQAAELGVSAFILKPFSFETLVDKVNHLLDRRMNPTEVDVIFKEAGQMADDGDLDGALAGYMKALDLAQNSLASIHFRIGQVHEKLRQTDQAESNYHEAIGLSNVYVEAYDALGQLKLNHNLPQEALECFQTGTKISPLNAARQFHLGEALMATGQDKEAEKAYKKAIKLDPSQTHILNSLGISLRRQNKLKEAREFLTQALQAADDDENLYYNLSRVCLDQGDQEEARSYLHRALDLKPEFKEAADLLEQLQQSAQN